MDSYAFLTMFPFFIAFNKKMEIVLVGNALMKIMSDLEGRRFFPLSFSIPSLRQTWMLRIDEEFELLRPLIKFTWDGV